jgi:hypothetical protein
MDEMRASRDGSAPKKPRGTKNSIAAAWASFAVLLARWALARVVNRRDAWGTYLPLSRRTPKQQVVASSGNLTKEVLVNHFLGRDVGDLIGLYSTSVEKTCRWVVVQVDHCGPKNSRRHRANRKAAIALYERLRGLSFEPLLISTNNRGAFQVWALFRKPVAEATAHGFACWLVRDWRELGFAKAPEVFPKEPKTSGKAKDGNLVPLPGRHDSRGCWACVWVGHWASGVEAVHAILETRGSDPKLIPAEVFAATEGKSSGKACPTSRAPVPRGQRVHSLARARPIDKVLPKLKNVTPSGSGWTARCPGHADSHNSLSVAEGDDGRVLVFCHAGCLIDDIVDALDLKMRDLFDRRSRHRRVRDEGEE